MWTKLKDSKVFGVILVGAVLFSGGYFLGRQNKLPVQERLIEDVATKQELKKILLLNSLLEQELEVANSTITELKSHVKIVERIVIQKDGTTTVDRTTESDTNTKIDSKTNTTEKTNSSVSVSDTETAKTDTNIHKESEKIPVMKSWFVGPMVTFLPMAPIGRQFLGGIIVGRHLGNIPILDLPVSGAISASVPIHQPIALPSIGVSLTVGF